MPRQSQSRSNIPATTAPAPGLALPEDVRNDLLRAQAGQIESIQRLPKVKIMPQGVCLFEFPEGETEREFSGVILNSHPRNLLWDRPYGADVSDEEAAPACVANDGRYGTPRPGFAHLGLADNMARRERGAELLVADGTDRVECATCPYNQWGSKGLLPHATEQDRQSKGKAVINQKAIYIMLADREMPVELIIPPTSLRKYDEYLASLLNRGVPVQAVVTRFRQERAERGRLQWSVVTFEKESDVTQEVFNAVLERRQRFQHQINPAVVDYSQYAAPTEIAEAEVVDDEIPF